MTSYLSYQTYQTCLTYVAGDDKKLDVKIAAEGGTTVPGMACAEVRKCVCVCVCVHVHTYVSECMWRVLRYVRV